MDFSGEPESATATNAQTRRIDVFIGSNRSKHAERFAAVGMLFFNGQLRSDTSSIKHRVSSITASSR
jgi:hypothetical protein